jgi:hypothetical protein
MPYGTLKADTLTYYTATGDVNLAISGIALQGAALVSGVSGIFTTVVSGATVTGNAGQFTTITGGTANFANITGVSGTFTTRISGATVTGNTAQFTTATAVTGVFTTSVSGATVTGDLGLFNTLSGNQVVLATGLSIPSGSASSPSISVNGDPNTGLYSPGADQVAISTNGTGRLFVDASGNVGVGTGSPATLFHLSSATGTATPTPTELRIATTSNGSDWSTASPWGRVSFYSADASNNGPKTHATIDTIAQGTAGGHSALRFAIADLTTTLYEGMRFECTGSTGQTFTTFSTSGSERLRITSDGKLGLGSSAPSKLLTVKGADGSAAILLERSNSGLASLGQIGFSTVNGIVAGIDSTSVTDSNNGALRFWTTGGSAQSDVTGLSQRMVITSGGLVGIGTTPNADSRLHVKSGANDSNPVLRLEAATNNFLNFRQTGSVYDIHVTAGDPLSFTIGASERARIDGSGRLLVGTTTTSSNNRLIVQSNTDSATGPATLLLAKGDNAPGSGSSLGLLRFGGSTHTHSAEIYAIRDGGTWTAGSSLPTAVVFSTTADGASSPTERVRISQNGVVTVKNGAVAEIGTLTDGATVTPDFAANCNFTLTISGNRTLANPTNITAGQTGSIFIIQGSGSNTLSWGSYWDFAGGTAPTLSTASGAIDRVDYVVRTSTSIHTVFTANYS